MLLGSTVGLSVEPTALITAGPADGSSTSSTTATFAFSSDTAGVAFRCSLDARKLRSCTSPKAYSSLSLGTHTFKVEAVSSGGTAGAPASRTWTVVTSATTTPGPSAGGPSPVSCTKYLGPGGDLQSFVDGLGAGDVGCLHGGTYTNSIDLNTSGWTLAAVPGQRATICGKLQFNSRSANDTVTGLTIDGSCSTENTVQVFGSQISLTYNDISNPGGSCLYLGNQTYGLANNVVVDHNRIHGCGLTSSNPQLMHGIYADSPRNGRITNNTIYSVAGFGIQLYPNAQGTDFEHNVVDGARTKSGLIFASQDSTASSNSTVRYNIFTNNHQYGIDYYWGGPVGTGNSSDHNCYWANGSGAIDSGSGFTDNGANVFADPRYVDRATGNYQLQAGSACAGMGPT